jgi:predicted nucleic acid-binding Zn ribbon protein
MLTLKLINCPACGKEISPQAISCPNCGQPIANQEVKEKSFCVKYAWLLILLFFLGLFLKIIVNAR